MKWKFTPSPSLRRGAFPRPPAERSAASRHVRPFSPAASNCFTNGKKIWREKSNRWTRGKKLQEPLLLFLPKPKRRKRLNSGWFSRFRNDCRSAASRPLWPRFGVVGLSTPRLIWEKTLPTLLWQYPRSGLGQHPPQQPRDPKKEKKRRLVGGTHCRHRHGRRFRGRKSAAFWKMLSEGRMPSPKSADRWEADRLLFEPAAKEK